MGKFRRKFGPDINGTFPRPVVEGELPDVEVSAEAKGVRAVANGLIDIDVVFTIPPYDASAQNPLAELHAIAYAPGHGIPTDPELAVASTQPMASTTSTGTSAGGQVLVTIPNAPTGGLRIKTVLSYEDTTPVVTDPTDPTPEKIDP